MLNSQHYVNYSTVFNVTESMLHIHSLCAPCRDHNNDDHNNNNDNNGYRIALFLVTLCELIEEFCVLLCIEFLR